MRFVLALPFLALLAAGCTEYDLIAPDEDVDPGEIDPTQPNAVCEVAPNPVTPPFESATFDGSGSTAPEGATITGYAWELISAPAGSTATLPYANQPVVGPFTPLLAGDYTAQLTVSTSDGGSDSCEVTLTATPSEDLWIEMYWAVADDDMDLHVLAPSGSPRSDRDCYFGNCQGGYWLDWGQPGVQADDPILDLDDIPGTGPENINIDDPESGVFTVFVHDYPFTGPFAGDNNVTVNVYLGGTLAWSDTRTISGEDTDTYFCEIEWPSGMVTGL